MDIVFWYARPADALSETTWCQRLFEILFYKMAKRSAMRLLDYLKVAEALAVILGVGAALYEFYFGDRFAQRQAMAEFDQRSFEVASGLFDGGAMMPFVEVATRYNEPSEERLYKNADAAVKKATEDVILTSGFPILFKIAEIDSCLQNKLCNPAIVLGMTCAPILGVQREFKALTRRYSGVSQLNREKPLLRMATRCSESV